MHFTSTIGQYMTPQPRCAGPEVSAREAIELMTRFEIRHLPIVENDCLVGLVSERDLQVAELLPATTGLKLSDLMVRHPYCANPATPLREVADVMARQKYGSVLVVNEHGHLLGIFTSTDGMRALRDSLLEMKETSALRSLA